MRDIKRGNVMKIVVYGLGIIGASVCATLKRAGYAVYGRNRSREPIAYALSHGMIDGEVQSYDGADLVVLALPPRVVMRELDEGQFSPNTIVVDICGVKKPLENVVYSRPRAYRYIGAHPMAGKETTGILSASVTLFDGANLILTRHEKTDDNALASVKKLGKEMGFGNIVECSAEYHDNMIALTSQLAHVVSNAYVKSPLTEACAGFTGGSFQDMTRIAGLDENVWTELFSLNSTPLIGELDRLIEVLQKYRAALGAANEEKMRGLLREGKEYHAAFMKKKGDFPQK